MIRLAALVAAMVGTLAAQPRLTNGRLETRAAASGLNAELQSVLKSSSGPAWIGYAVPSASPRFQSCCYDSSRCCGGCALETGRFASTGTTAPPGPVKLEGDSTFHVLLRIEGGAVGRIRTFSVDCELDAGGLTLHWLTSVTADDSVAVLRSLIVSDRRTDQSLAAISMHAGAAAISTLIDFARNGAGAQQRGQALFWLAQRAADKEIAVISEAVDKDPDTEVKQKAVFALYQLPRDRGIPLLINVARTHGNAAVRKQAMFWLGQSKDPRAIQLFEDVLAK